MSDDTPTERFQPPHDENGQPLGPPSQDSDGRSRKLLIWLVVLGGLILVALIIVLTLLFSRGTGSDPVASPVASTTATPTTTAPATPNSSPSSSASESPSASSAPEAESPHFTSFEAGELRCSAGGPGFPPTYPHVIVSWTSEGAIEAWYADGDEDAADLGAMQIPVNGDQTDFAYERSLGCDSESFTFTITLVGPDGEHVNETTTIMYTGDI